MKKKINMYVNISKRLRKSNLTLCTRALMLIRPNICLVSEGKYLCEQMENGIILKPVMKPKYIQIYMRSSPPLLLGITVVD